jgi:hypothetical protein
MNNVKLYNKHLKEIGKGYFQHLCIALMLARKTFGCAIASLIHAFIPFMLVDHTSKTINKLNEIFIERRRKKYNYSTVI